MKITRRRLNQIIYENLFKDLKDKLSKNKNIKTPSENLPDVEEEQSKKFVCVFPTIPDDLPNDNARFLVNKISREVGKNLGVKNEIAPTDFAAYLNSQGMDDSSLDVGSQLELANLAPELKVIFTEMTRTPDKKGMEIKLDMYHGGQKVSSSGGSLAGVKAGYRDDGTHESDEQLARYVKELVT